MDLKDLALVITSLGGIIAPILAGIAAIYAAKAKYKSDANGLVADKTHALVNSAMARILRVAAVALQRIADYSKTPEDAKAAADAQQAYDQHMANQEKLDAKVVAAVVLAGPLSK